MEAHINKGGDDINLGYRWAYWLGIDFVAVTFFVKDAGKDNEGTVEEAPAAQRKFLLVADHSSACVTPMVLIVSACLVPSRMFAYSCLFYLVPPH